RRTGMRTAREVADAALKRDVAVGADGEVAHVVAWAPGRVELLSVRSHREREGTDRTRGARQHAAGQVADAVHECEVAGRRAHRCAFEDRELRGIERTGRSRGAGIAFPPTVAFRALIPLSTGIALRAGSARRAHRADRGGQLPVCVENWDLAGSWPRRRDV